MTMRANVRRTNVQGANVRNPFHASKANNNYSDLVPESFSGEFGVHKLCRIIYACVHLCARLYVCTSARLHVCTSARLHVCTSARLHVCMSARLHVCTSARLHVCTTVCMHPRQSVCASAFEHMYVCTHKNFSADGPLCDTVTTLVLTQPRVTREG